MANTVEIPKAELPLTENGVPDIFPAEQTTLEEVTIHHSAKNPTLEGFKSGARLAVSIAAGLLLELLMALPASPDFIPATIRIGEADILFRPVVTLFVVPFLIKFLDAYLHEKRKEGTVTAAGRPAPSRGLIPF